MTLRHVLLTLLLLLPCGARAELSPSELARASLTTSTDAAAPLQLSFRNTENDVVTLAKVFDRRPSLLLFVDYTCRTTCGPAMAIASGALAETGLDPARDFRLAVVGLDEKDSLQDALAMSKHILNPELKGATAILRGSRGNIERLTEALGYRYSYDAAADQFAHPTGVFVMTSSGRVSRVLSSLALNPHDLRLALVEAGAGNIGSVSDRLSLLCYGFDAAHGVYSLAATRLLQVLSVICVFGIVGLIIRASRSRKVARDGR